MAKVQAVDLGNIQGDILEGLAKRAQTFVCFRILRRNVATFRRHLEALLPLITSAEEAKWCHECIDASRRQSASAGVCPPILAMSGVNIAFSQRGLDILGIQGDIGDDIFKDGMKADADNIGDDLEDWDARFRKDIHGVIVVSASDNSMLQKVLSRVKNIFQVGQDQASILQVARLDGHTRPGKEHANEHFGFKAGVSQPSIKDINAGARPLPYEEPIRQGVILVGREGDDIPRPTWAHDGSFLAFRYLRQLVPEFHRFTEANALKVPAPKAPGDPTGAELLAARILGRWPSGAPVDLTPHRDDPLMEDPNDFCFDPGSQARCPFAAHVRKMNPRADLDYFGGTEFRRIIRRSIPFGPEVTEREVKEKRSSEDPALERGLLFVCYQSNLSRGFQSIQEDWASNASFPPGKFRAQPPVPESGIDPIIGIAKPRLMVGLDPRVDGANKVTKLGARWVVPRGGEYFFSPSISSLQVNFASADHITT